MDNLAKKLEDAGLKKSSKVSDASLPSELVESDESD